MDDLLGAKIEDIMVPESRRAIQRLVQDLIVAERRAVSSSVDEEEDGEEDENGENNDGGANGRNDSSGEPMVISMHSSSEQSFPLLEVKVDRGAAGQMNSEEAKAAGEDVSDSSGDPPGNNKNDRKEAVDHGASGTTELSSLTHKNSSFGTGSSGDDHSPLPRSQEERRHQQPHHSKKARKSASPEQVLRFSHKDDVMGASVTANNADARLSSLMHHPDECKPSSSEDQPTLSCGIRRKHAKITPGGNADCKQQRQEEQQSASSIDSSISATNDNNNNERRNKNNTKSNTNNRGGENISSEDSGYRESNESPNEESNESPEDSSSESANSFDRSQKKSELNFCL